MKKKIDSENYEIAPKMFITTRRNNSVNHRQTSKPKQSLTDIKKNYYGKNDSTYKTNKSPPYMLGGIKMFSKKNIKHKLISLS